MSNFLTAKTTLKPTPTTNDNFIILTINGGIGKNIAATAVVKAIKKHYPDYNIIVITGWIEVWQNNPYIFRFFRHAQTPYFYSDYIKGKNVVLMMQEPYATEDYIFKRKSLIELWCTMYNVPYNGELPEFFFNYREVEYVRAQYVGTAPIMVLHTNGGAPNDNMKISWMRDMPLELAQQVVNTFMGDYQIYHIRRPDQPALNNTTLLNVPLRLLFIVIAFSQKRLFIDSFAQHAAAALTMPSTVLWVKNTPNVLGYGFNDNIEASVIDEMDTLFASFVEPYDISGQIDQCPYPVGTKLFDEQMVIQSVAKQQNIIAPAQQPPTIDNVADTSNQ